MWLYIFIIKEKKIEDLQDFANYVNGFGYEMTHYDAVLYKDDDRIYYTGVFQFAQGAPLPAAPFNPPN